MDRWTDDGHSESSNNTTFSAGHICLSAESMKLAMLCQNMENCSQNIF
jgi:hypothetical protein